MAPIVSCRPRVHLAPSLFLSLALPLSLASYLYIPRLSHPITLHRLGPPYSHHSLRIHLTSSHRQQPPPPLLSYSPVNITIHLAFSPASSTFFFFGLLFSAFHIRLASRCFPSIASSYPSHYASFLLLFFLDPLQCRAPWLRSLFGPICIFGNIEITCVSRVGL